MFFMIMNSDIDKIISILFGHLSSIILEIFKDRALIIPELLEFIELHTYKFGLVYLFLQLGPRDQIIYKSFRDVTQSNK